MMSQLSTMYIGEDTVTSLKLESTGDVSVDFKFDTVGEFFRAFRKFKNSVDIIFIELQLVSEMKPYAKYINRTTGTKVYVISNYNRVDPHFMSYLKDSGFHALFNMPQDERILFSRLSILAKGTGKRRRIHSNYQIGFAKRIFDIVFASSALLLLSPLFLLVAALIKFGSKGPVFYASKRVGTSYKIFDFYKFRSMRTDADQMIDQIAKNNQYTSSNQVQQVDVSSCACGGECTSKLYADGEMVCENTYLVRSKAQSENNFIKVKNDPRITKVGRFIRSTSIDELPQLFNVLKGDMSIVGNRPLPLYEAEQLTSDQFAERFLAAAGITGLWQVSKRGQAEMSADERKLLDNQYAQSQSLWFDIKLILKTFPALLQKENV